MSNVAESEMEEPSCCCCFAKADLCSMTAPHNFHGKFEICTVMIAECFGIQMMLGIEDVHKRWYVMCKSCISHLRDAIQLRHKVENAYHRFKGFLDNPESAANNCRIKTEVTFSANDSDREFSENDMDIDKFLSVHVKEEPENRSQNFYTNINSSSSIDNSNFKKCALTECNSDAGAKISLKAHKKKLDSNKVKISDTGRIKRVPLTCKTCNENFSSFRDLRSHTIVHFPNYVCDICKKAFIKKNDLRRHIYRHEEFKIMYPCNLCEKVLKGKENLNRHMKTHTRFYKCPYCLERFSDYEKKTLHLINMHNVSPVDTIDMQKDDIIRSSSDINKLLLKKDNIKLQTDSIKDIKEEETSLKIPQFQLDENDLTCKVCNETFPWYRNLKAHMAIHFPNFICHICSKTFTGQTGLNAHLRNHEENKTIHTCNICGKNFKGKYHLHYHMKRHEDGFLAYKCPHCPERFKEFRHRTLHLSNVHNEERKKYRCKHCTTRFVSSSYLAEHVKSVHLKVKRHKCEICGMSFFQKCALTRHMLVHTGIKKFQCKVCSKAFSRNSNLTVHMRIHNKT